MCERPGPQLRVVRAGAAGPSLAALLLIGAAAPLEGAGEGCASTAVERDGPAPAVTTARFVVSRAGVVDTVTYMPERNLVFCRRTGEVLTWVRLAELGADDGEHGPHLDIDVCDVAAGATYEPMNPRTQPCPGGKTWAVWWHDGLGGAFHNTMESEGCALTLRMEGDVLEGTFACGGLVAMRGGDTVDIVDGWFRCELGGAAGEDGG